MIHHYPHGGSTAARQIVCPSWQIEAKKNPGTGSSIYAEEGTALHDVMEQLMEDSALSPQDFLDKEVNDITLDEDHVERLDMALAAFKQLTKKFAPLDDFLTEVTVELTDEIGGTCDLLLYGPKDAIVLDWKFGQGVAVSPVDNAQGMFYAMCAEHEMPNLFEGKRITIAIVQPMPSQQTHETLQLWELPPKQFKLFKSAYMKSINAIGYQTGPHCQFCPGAATCPEKTGQAQKALMLDPQQVNALTTSLDMALELKGWIKSVESMAHEQMEAGTKLEGYKLVQKRATRKWSDEKDVETKLRRKRIKVVDFMAPAKLKSVAQLEKLKGLDMSVVAAYIIKSSTGTTIAKESDPREEALAEGALVNALSQLA